MKKLASIFLFMLLMLSLISCKNTSTVQTITEQTTTIDSITTTKDNQSDTLVCPYCHKNLDECTCEPLEIRKIESLLLEGTIYETKVYKYLTNKEGPGIVIIGGIHGDETAGWNAALRLIQTIESEEGIRGNILIVPEVNILADHLEQRYPGRTSGSRVTTYDGVEYSDLNRSFSVGRASNSTTTTIRISNAIVDLIKDFDDSYCADYIIDLHEASRSWDDDRYDEESTSLGNTLIYSNLPSKVKKIINIYNNNYRLEGETKFTSNEATQKGSFSLYHTTNYPDSIVFTIETNRDNYDGSNHISLETRIRIQLNMLEAMFDYAWGRESK